VGSTTEEPVSPSETMRPASYATQELKSSDENIVKMKDEFEPINIEGQEKTGIWVHHPGSEVCQTWEPRKGQIQTRIPETRTYKEVNGYVTKLENTNQLVPSRDTGFSLPISCYGIPSKIIRSFLRSTCLGKSFQF
jgi:hypothetical protein